MAIGGVRSLLHADGELEMLGKEKSVGAYVRQLAMERGFSGVVMVRGMGETIVRSAFGMANVELQVPNTPETKFRIGSITKQFTAMMVMILAERGKLLLRDRLIDRLPGLPPHWSNICIHHLLNHTSGLMHSWDIPGFLEKVMVPYPLEAMIEEIRDRPLFFVPGEGYRYSGIGYFLLARIIETASGQQFEAALKSAILDPLGMKNSGADSEIAIVMRRAAGYVHVNGMVQNAPIIHMPNLTGGGNMYSTVDDLTLWDRALTSGALVSADSYRAMYTPVRESYGYGWRVLQIKGRAVLEHSGGVKGFRADIRRIPEMASCIIVLSNDQDTEKYLTEMVETIHELLETP